MNSETRIRTYRFSARDAAGLLLGLQAGQCAVLGVGIVMSGALLNIGAPALFVLAPLLVALGLTFGRLRGEPVYALLPVALAWTVARRSNRHRWFATIPCFKADGTPVAQQPHLPPALGDVEISELVSAEWARRGRVAGAAALWDRRRRLVSAVLRARGREFILQDRDEQERLLQGWGDALAGFCREHGLVSSLRWAEWATPAALDEQVRYLRANAAVAEESPEFAAYVELLEAAEAGTTRHDVLVTITVDARQVRGTRGGATEHALGEELRLLVDRLHAAGLKVDLPLSPSEVAAAARRRLDPFSPSALARGQGLASLAGVVAPENAGPMAVVNEWDHVRVDGALHSAYVVAEWPRLEMPPNWMEPLLLHAGAVRTVVVHYEPVPPSRSQRQIDRDSTRLGSDEEQRARSGFRIGARHHRAQADVAEREAELVAGYVELQYVGFVIVSAPDLDTLRDGCAEYQQIAAQSGLELRRLDGRHDAALRLLLPLGAGIDGRRAT
jgi:hypothetical protein